MEPTFGHAGALIEAAVFAPAFVAVTVAIVRTAAGRRRVRAAGDPAPSHRPAPKEEDFR
jgi:hypothetical protein